VLAKEQPDQGSRIALDQAVAADGVPEEMPDLAGRLERASLVYAESE